MINFGILLAYKKLFTATTRYKILYGGRGAGKSAQVARRFIALARSKPFFRGAMMRAVSSDIRDSQFQEIKDALEQLELAHEFVVNETHYSFTHKGTGHKIISKGFQKSSGSRTGKTKSLAEVTHLWIEEADEVSWDDFKKADQSIRTIRCKHLEVILTLNTEDGTTWVRTKYIDANRSDVTAIHTTYKDNLKHVAKSFVVNLEILAEIDPESFRVDALGEWGSARAKRPFAKHYDIVKHTSVKAVYNPNLDIYFAIDFNVSPFVAIAAHVWEDYKGEHCHIIMEFVVDDATTDSMAQAMRDEYGQDALNLCYITGDHTGTSRAIGRSDMASMFSNLRDSMRIHETQIDVPANPRHVKSRSDCNHVLMHHPDFKINLSACPTLCADLKSVGVDHEGKIIKSDRSKADQLADALDGFRYLCNTFLHEWIERDRDRRNRDAA